MIRTMELEQAPVGDWLTRADCGAPVGDCLTCADCGAPVGDCPAGNPPRCSWCDKELGGGD